MQHALRNIHELFQAKVAEKAHGYCAEPSEACKTQQRRAAACL
jgi:hypothetical protein